jgi:transglutaminase-like putative cysteine protease
MRLTVRHVTRYHYDAAGLAAVQRLRLTPRDNSAQTIVDWRVEAPGIEAAPSYVDGFGNVTQLIAYRHPGGELAITAAGTVETSDAGGVVGLLGEVASPAVFMRETALTRSNAAIDRFAARAAADDPVATLHNLLSELKERVAYDTDATHAGTTAAEAFKAGQGVCQDHAHIFIAAARSLAIPARYVTGYLHLEGEGAAAAHHAWAEAFVPELGWIGFDAANGVCPTDRYIRLACGFDAPSAAPIVGTRRGGGSEELSVDVTVEQQQQQ